MNDMPKSKAMQSLELQLANDMLRDFLPLMMDRMMPAAKLRKAKFDALITAGFTEPQAIDIVAKSPLVD